MFEEAEGQGVANAAAGAELLDQLRQLTGKPEPRVRKSFPDAASDGPSAVATGAGADWEIHFTPGPDLMRTGVWLKVHHPKLEP